jgi:hypothetical protein
MQLHRKLFGLGAWGSASLCSDPGSAIVLNTPHVFSQPLKKHENPQNCFVLTYRNSVL